jgi:hypothetical protein
MNVPALTTLFRQGAANVASAWGDAGAMLGALQGDAALMNAAMAASEIQPSLITASSTAAHAVSSSRLAFEASASVFAVGGYDDVVGVESTVQWMRGEDAPLAIVSPFQAVFAPPASAAERLHLAP